MSALKINRLPYNSIPNEDYQIVCKCLVCQFNYNDVVNDIAGNMVDLMSVGHCQPFNTSFSDQLSHLIPTEIAFV